MKYYYNEKTDKILVDSNEYTPYLKDRGYSEISKDQYDTIRERKLKELKLRHSNKYETEEE